MREKRQDDSPPIDIGIVDPAPERLRKFAWRVAAEWSFVHNHNFEVTAASVADAMIAADALGQSRKRRYADNGFGGQGSVGSAGVREWKTTRNGAGS